MPRPGGMLRLLLAEAGMRAPGKGASMAPEMAPEMETLKARLKATWMAGDYGTSGSRYPNGVPVR